MKNIAFFLLFFLLVSGHSNANSVGGSIGGWRITSNVAQGIGAKISATKDVIVNGASRAVTSSATVLPNAANVGKFIGKNLGAAAVIGAMDLLLDGVDYVMDPANNTISYNTQPKVPVSDGFTDNTDKYKSQYKYYKSVSGAAFTAYNALTVCQMYLTWWNTQQSVLQYSATSMLNESTCAAKRRTIKTGEVVQDEILIYRVVNPNLGATPTKDEESKRITVPVSTIGEQVISQAEAEVRAGNPAKATSLSRAVAQDMIQEAETDDTKARPIATELDKNISHPSDTDIDGTVTTPEVIDPVTGEVVKPSQTSSIAMQFPKACEWFPQLCLFIDWMQKPQELDEPDLPTKEIEKKEIDEELIKISSSSCPAPIDVNIPLPVFNTTYTDSISVSEYCPKIEKLAPVLQLLAFVLAIMIIKDI